MQAYRFDQFGLEHLKPVEIERPQPGPGELLLEMRAVSLNYRDLLMVTGRYNPRLKLPLIPCSDGVGVVVETGPACTMATGEEVIPLFSQDWLYGLPRRTMLKSSLGGPLNGTLCEYMVVAESACVRKPSHLSYVEASTLACAALTAWSALVKEARIGPASTVLILGTGGVSIFALQFARLLGARTIITSSSAEKLERARSLGADLTINYSERPSWEKEVYRMTGGEGVDLVIEVGGSGTLEKSIRSVRPGGTISLIGVLAGGSGELNLYPVLMQNIRIQGIVVGHRESFEEMNRAIELHGLHPVVDQVFPFAASVAAFEHLKSMAHFGKVCIEVKHESSAR
ncbi:MAG: NAD(P)-dependent alcohol dehydrogenase [Spirochaetales bacterium]|nr:NAD(P)-dependent alcohol dehydrogenase [Spirochaetales bacterium]